MERHEDDAREDGEEKTRSGVSGCIWSGSEQFHESRGLQYASNILETPRFLLLFLFFLSFILSLFFSIIGILLNRGGFVSIIKLKLLEITIEYFDIKCFYII